MGPCAMAARSALRAGVGLTTVFVPYESLTAIQNTSPRGDGRLGYGFDSYKGGVQMRFR